MLLALRKTTILVFDITLEAKKVNMNLRVPRFTFFVGAHHTVSGVLQKCSTDIHAKLIENDVQVFHPVEFREFIRAQSSEGSKNGGVKAQSSIEQTRQGLSKLYRDAISSNFQGRFLIFEEAFLGSVRMGLQKGLLYPNAHNQLKVLPAELDNPWHTICLVIRPYDEFFAASYDAVVRRGAVIDVDEFRANVCKLERNWLHIVEEIADRLPNAQIRLWKASETFELGDQIETELYGKIVGIIPSYGKVRSGLEKPDLGSGKNNALDFWSKKQSSQLKRAFDVHWEALTEQWPDALFAAR